MYNSRPKINAKIIFNDLLPNTKNALIIGKNNSDIIEILKSKKIKSTELQEDGEIEIMKYLEKQGNKNFDVIIMNLELCNYHRLRQLICTLVEKGKYAIIRFRNNSRDTKVTKKKRINKIIKLTKIRILKKFYSRKNFVCGNILFKPFAYYTVYFISKQDVALNFEPSFVDRVINFFTQKSEMSTTFSINKK